MYHQNYFQALLALVPLLKQKCQVSHLALETGKKRLKKNGIGVWTPNPQEDEKQVLVLAMLMKPSFDPVFKEECVEYVYEDIEPGSYTTLPLSVGSSYFEVELLLLVDEYIAEETSEAQRTRASSFDAITRLSTLLSVHCCTLTDPLVGPSSLSCSSINFLFYFPFELLILAIKQSREIVIIFISIGAKFVPHHCRSNIPSFSLSLFSSSLLSLL